MHLSYLMEMDAIDYAMLQGCQLLKVIVGAPPIFASEYLGIDKHPIA